MCMKVAEIWPRGNTHLNLDRDKPVRVQGQ